MSTKQLVDYDPEQQLAMAIGDVTFEAKLLGELNNQSFKIQNTVIHFSKDSCFCQFLAEPHIQRLTNRMQSNGFENTYINLSEKPEFKKFIPSTPSIAIIGSAGELIFLGPYSEGYGCLTGTGLVDTVITKVLSKAIENTLFIADAEGCYCNN